VFPVKVKKVEMKRKIVFHLSDFVDEENFDNFDKIDTVTDFIKKKYKDAIVNFKGRTIEVMEL
jgi:hydroxymethylglutaryl-CoA reductase